MAGSLPEITPHAICERFGSAFTPPVSGSKVGLALAMIEQIPIQGVRVAIEGDNCGWFIWGGPFSEAPDFFQPVHVNHLGELIPAVLPFLALEPGFRFITDTSGYEDVWRE